MASVRPYTRRPHHWQATISLGKDPDSGRYLRRKFVICPASCAEGCSPFPEYRARTKREAERVAERIAEQLQAQQVAVAVESGTFARLVDDWIIWLTDEGKARNTLHSYRSLADRHLLPTFGERQVDSITTVELQLHIDALRASGLSPASCERILSVARQAFRWGAQRGRVTANPAREVRRPAQHRRQVEIPPWPVVRDVLGVLVQDEAYPWLGVFAIMAATTGARRGELCALRWSDVDLDARTLRIAHSVNRWLEVGPTKTHATRVVALSEMGLTAVRAWREHELAELRRFEGDVRDLPGSWFLFSGDSGPTVPMNPDKVTTSLRTALKRFRRANPGVLSDDRMWMHGFRHYAASAMISGGVDPVQAARVLGQSSAKLTLDTYGHAADASGRAAVEQIERALRP